MFPNSFLMRLIFAKTDNSENSGELLSYQKESYKSQIILYYILMTGNGNSSLAFKMWATEDMY